MSAFQLKPFRHWWVQRFFKTTMPCSVIKSQQFFRRVLASLGLLNQRSCWSARVFKYLFLTLFSKPNRLCNYMWIKWFNFFFCRLFSRGHWQHLAPFLQQTNMLRKGGFDYATRRGGRGGYFLYWPDIPRWSHSSKLLPLTTPFPSFS